jgi:hypothetical protein
MKDFGTCQMLSVNGFLGSIRFKPQLPQCMLKPDLMTRPIGRELQCFMDC